MAEPRIQDAASYKPVRAPRGPSLSCKGWQQEAALRLLMNSLDPAVAEHPEELVVSGGIGKLARDWQAFHAIGKSLQELENDETLVVRSGEPAPIMKTRFDVPRVLVLNSTLSPASQGPPSAQIGRARPPRATRFASDWMFTGPPSALPEAYETFRAAARKHFGGSLLGRLVVAAGMGGMGGAQGLAATLNGAAFLGIDADAARIKRRVKAGYCEVMVNHLDEALRILKNAVRKREPASVGLIGNAAEMIPELADRGVLPDLLTDQTPADDPFAYIPRGFTVTQAAELLEKDPHGCCEKAWDSIATQVRAMLELRRMGAVVFEFGNGLRARALALGVADAREIPDFRSEYLLEVAPDRGLLTVVALSGDPDDQARVDALCLELFPDSELRDWIAMARKHPSPGLPARSCWVGRDEAAKLGIAINDLVARGEIKAPMAMGRSIQIRSRGLLEGHPAGQAPDSGLFAHLFADAPAWAEIVHAASSASWLSLQATEALDQSSSFIVVADGGPQTAARIERLFADHLAAVPLSTPPRQNRS